jgi:hypothetical protein
VSAASEIRRWSRREWPRRKNDSHIGFPESRERSRSKEGGNERSPGGRKLPNARAWGSSQQDRSLWPSFWRTPAPRSRLRTRNQSAFRAASEAARQRRESERSHCGSVRRGNDRPHRSTAAEQGIGNARRRTAHSGRNSPEFRHPGARVSPDFAQPLTPAVVLTNAGAPFAAPNAQSIRLQSRERSGAPAPRERAVPARIHPPRAKRAAPGTDTSVPPHCRPISPTHRSRGRRCLSPAPEATARAERPEPSPATCSFATLHRLPDAHHLRSLPETRCSPAPAKELCLLPPFLSASAAPAPGHAGHVEQAAFSRRSYQIPRLHHDPAL